MLTGDYLENIMVQLSKEEATNIYQTANAEVAAISPQMETVNCPVCSSINKEHVIDTNGHGSLAQCKECNVVYANKRPTLDVCKALYRYYIPSNLVDVEIRKSQLETRPKELNDDLDRIEYYIGRGELLDVGASSGDFLVYARVRGWKVTATELSELCANFMAQTLNINVLLGNILDIELERKKYEGRFPS